MLDSNVWWPAALLVAVAVFGWLVQRSRKQLRLLRRFSEAVAAETEIPELRLPLDDQVVPFATAVRRAVEAVDARVERAGGEKARLEAVLGGMVEGVVVIDTNGTVLLSNSRAQEILELPADQPSLGRSLIELTRNPDLHNLIRRVKAEGEFDQSSALDVVLDAAGQRVVQVAATPIEEPAGTVHAFILVFHDITDLKRTERVRRDFVANVSHELRTPLAAIRGYTETLLGGALDEPLEARRFLVIIERHAERLGRLVNDLLTLSDLELGLSELRCVPVRPELVVEATFDILRDKAIQGDIQLEQRLDPATPPVDADQDRLEQALLNLVDNSIKYTPNGGSVTVHISPVLPAEISAAPRPSEVGGFVEIAVRDTGIGVPAGELPRLTERFYRVDRARSRELGGTGLGLAIVKHIVQVHGGRMSIESELNRGTTVRLFLPAAEQAEMPGSVVPSASASA